MKDNKRALKVFLSYAHTDEITVRALYEHLTNDGIDVWFDKANLFPGQDWEMEIDRALRECDVIVICHSKQFNKVGYRQKEVKLARKHADYQPTGKIYIIPARLEECDVLDELKQWQWVNLFEEDGYESLFRSLSLRAEDVGAALPKKRKTQATESPPQAILIPEQEFTNWLNESNGIGYLCAEAELPWLGKVFVPPQEFDQVMASRSSLVMGDEGSGKTALEIQLKQHLEQKGASHILFASWRPQLPTNTDSDVQITESLNLQVMDALSFSLLLFLISAPSKYFSAPSWAQDFILWFIKKFLQDDLEFHIRRLTEQINPSISKTLNNLFLSDATRSFSPEMTPDSILNNFAESINTLGFEKIWIFVIGLDTLYLRDQERMHKAISNFISTLEYYEHPAFVLKITIPKSIGLHLIRNNSLLKRQFNIYDLSWREEDLTRIVEVRAGLILNRENISLEELCKDDAWLQWLKRYAGYTPRGWLDLARPILRAYIKKGQSLSKAEWLDVYRESPPMLHIDLESSRVYIGYGEIPINEIGFRLLSYLYKHPNRSCKKSELYYQALKGLPKEPRNNNDYGWEDLRSWEGALDTAIWRLRRAIEWDVEVASPLYIVSVHGRGEIRLENTI